MPGLTAPKVIMFGNIRHEQLNLFLQVYFHEIVLNIHFHFRLKESFPYVHLTLE